MTTTREQLLAAIRSDPSDDTVRLAYADLLDEEGGEKNEERARYIRGGILRGECSYVAKVMTDWRFLRGIETSWRKGFVEGVVCAADAWFEHAAEILSSEPVRDVVLTTTPVLEFRQVVRTDSFDPDTGGLVIRCKWRVAYYKGGHWRPDAPEEVFGLEQDLSREVLADRERRDWVEEVMVKRIEVSRTPLAYLQVKWKDIRFEIMSESGAHQYYDDEIERLLPGNRFV